MTLISLNNLEAPLTEVQSDVCIAGAGAAGLYLASRLRAGGLNVTLLEAGPRICVEGREIGIEAELSSTSFRGATEGRAFGLGGTTSRWGGQLSLHRRQDLRMGNDPTTDSVWQHIVSTVDARSRSVALRLGVITELGSPIRSEAGNKYAQDALTACGLDCAASSWLPFRRRHLGFLLGGKTGNSTSGQTYLDAVAADWEIAPHAAGSGQVFSLEARSLSGRRLRVQANTFVLAAGAIE
jgi:hypothetical protein